MSSDAATSNDPFYRAKRETYQGFMRLAVTGLVAVIIILVGMAAFLL